MSKITNYINNLFYRLPQTKEVAEAKENITEIMDDKYNALRAGGMSESEAFGTVVSEFGSMEELCAELNIPAFPSDTDLEQENEYAKRQYEQTIWFLDDYSDFKKKFAIGIACGVACCILGVIFTLVAENLFGDDSLFSDISILIFGAIGAVQFIYWGIQSGHYEEMKQHLQRHCDDISGQR